MAVAALREMLSDSRTARSAPRVRLAGPTAALAAPGGGEVQMRSLADALAAQGVDARPWRPWEEGFDGFDCLHLFGSLPEHLPTVLAAKQRGLAVVLSPIVWFDMVSRWRERASLFTRVRGAAGMLARRSMPRMPDWRRRLYLAVDRLLPNSMAEAAQIERYVGIDCQRQTVVPNAADPNFAEADAQLFEREYGLRDFVLYVGRIEPRKNQLGFLRALRGSHHPVVFIGEVVPGQEDYLDACRREARDNVHFLPRIGNLEPRLASAYAACRCLALVSWFETPGLAAIEAAMTGAPLALTERGSTREYFGDFASYARPGSRRSIRAAVEQAIDRGRDSRLAAHVMKSFTWRIAAERTLEAYRDVC